MRITRLSSLLVALLTFGVANASDPLTKIASQGVTTLTENVDNVVVRVNIRTREVDIGKPSDGRPGSIESSCTYSKYPCSLIDRVQIIVNQKSVFVPRSAFCDLADLTGARIEIHKNGASTLTLYGGDASESFIAKIEFDETQIKRRTLASGESASHVLQETRYFPSDFE